jgi:REP element-mobilizing transposase RayT
MKHYLVTTAHLENSVWFRDDADFRIGMNTTALIASLRDIKIFTFILMSNHLHFVIQCWPGEAELFINEIKRHYSRYIENKYGIREFLRRNKMDIREIDPSTEELERALAYVQMNCVAAGICLYPSQYRWGTGKCFFSESPAKGTPFGTLSRKEQKKLLHSNFQVPDNYLVCDDGYILPESYIEIQSVEKVFRNARRMSYFLNTSSKARQKLEMWEGALPSFKDQVIISALPDLCQSLFRKDTLSTLIDSEKGELLRQIRYRFSSNIHQLARVTNMEYDNVVRLLDTV